MSTPGSPAAAGPGCPDDGAIVIAPAHPAIEHDERDIVFEVRESLAGAPVLPVFSSVPRLVEALGHAQQIGRAHV